MKSVSQIRELTIPIQNSSGSVNLYAIKGPEGYYLIDTGVATMEAKEIIDKWLPRPLMGIFITHGHVDHIGLAGKLSQEHNCPLYLYFEEYQRLKDPVLQTVRLAQLLAMGGVPLEILQEATGAYEITRYNIVSMLAGAEIRELSEGDIFSTELGDLGVIHTPGHANGHCCYYLADNKLLFSGDHILANVFPNPVTEIGHDGKRRLALVEYLESLKKIASLPITMFYPGHGKPFDNLDEILSSFYINHLKREQKILGNLNQVPQTPFQITQKLYPGVRGMNIFLAISRVWGYLDLLELEGKLMVQIKDDIAYYCK